MPRALQCPRYPSKARSSVPVASNENNLAGTRCVLVSSMARDVRNLTVFQLADNLAIDIYAATRRFPDDERYGLTTQLRRAAVSVATNLVEGSERTGEKDYLRFVDVAAGSAAEVRYLLTFARRLGFVADTVALPLEDQYDRVLRTLQNLRKRLREGGIHATAGSR